MNAQRLLQRLYTGEASTIKAVILNPVTDRLVSGHGSWKPPDSSNPGRETKTQARHDDVATTTYGSMHKQSQHHMPRTMSIRQSQQPCIFCHPPSTTTNMTNACVLRSLDLFCGIGGMSLALRDVCRPVAYVDNDPFACAVVRSNIQRGRLHAAPVLQQDIRTIDFRGPLFVDSVDVVLAGFPCQDASLMRNHGTRLGTDGAKTGLIREVMRAVDETHARFVFLENVPGIVQTGMTSIIDMFWTRRFVAACMILSAEDVGALHLRRRWFCLASRSVTITKAHTITKDDVRDVKRIDNQMWSVDKEPVSRLTAKTRRDLVSNRNAMMALGQSVVPACVQSAWNHLNLALAGKLPFAPDTRGMAHNILVFRRAPGPKAAGVRFYVKPTTGSQRPKLRLFVRSPSDANVTTTLERWPTPVGHCGADAVKSTSKERTLKFLPNVMMYELGSLRRYSGSGVRICDIYPRYMVNYMFVEWLMGYPRGWIPTSAGSTSSAGST